jgi:hypothetical protein
MAFCSAASLISFSTQLLSDRLSARAAAMARSLVSGASRMARRSDLIVRMFDLVRRFSVDISGHLFSMAANVEQGLTRGTPERRIGAHYAPMWGAPRKDHHA